MTAYNIYCDESCHLINKSDEDNRYMVIGGVMCPVDYKRKAFDRIKQIKKETGLSTKSEIKWTSVTKAKLIAYKRLVDYFFDNDFLNFRAVSIDKNTLKHDVAGHSHDEFYYKIYWLMLQWFIDPMDNQYNIYVDIKDTQGCEKVEKLFQVLANDKMDFERESIKKVQEVRSHEVALLQLADLFIGAISYANKYPNGGLSEAKQELLDYIRERSSRDLINSTSLGATKFNLLQWKGSF